MTTSPSRIWTAGRVVTGGLAIAALALLWVTAPSAERRWTDDRSIDVAAGAEAPRDILWTPPRPVEGAVNSDVDEYEPRISGDGTTMVFVRRRPGENADLFSAQWSPSGWAEATPIATVNTPADELGPDLSHDGTRLTFYSDREGGLGGYDLWQCERLSAADPWGEARNLGPAVNSPANEYGPSLTPDGQRLYFSSNRPRSTEAPTSEAPWSATMRERRSRRDYDLYVSGCGEASKWGDASRIALLSTDADEGAPAVSPAGDFLYFASDRPGGRGGLDLYRIRLTPTAEVGADALIESLGEAINSAANELDPALASEGFRLYFSSDRDTPAAPRYDLFTSTSREVRSLVRSDSPGWQGWWERLWPWLLLLALLALLAYLLAKLIAHHDAWRKRIGTMGLLARCLIASVLIHLLIAALLAAWKVGGIVAESLRGGGHRVILASTGIDAPNGELARQVMTTMESPASELTLERSPVVLASPIPSEERAIELPSPSSMSERSVPESRSERADEAAPPRVAEAAPSIAPLTSDVPASLPEHSTPAAREEPTLATSLDRPVRSSELAPSPVGATEAPAPQLPIQAMPAASPERLTAPNELASQLRSEPAPPSTSSSLPSESASPSMAAAHPAAPAASRAEPSVEPAALPSLAANVSALDMPRSPSTVPLPAASLTSAPVGATTALPSAQTLSDQPISAPDATRALLDSGALPAASAHATLPSATPTSTGAADSRLPELPTPIEDFAQRDPAARDELLEEMGGNEETERAVARALEWLKRHQEPDGRWSSRRNGGSVDADAAMTGLALLTYLGAGHTHQEEGPYRASVDRGIRWILGRANGRGDLRESRTAGVAADTMYGQTIATVALCEAYAMTRDPELAPLAQRAVTFVLDAAARARQGRVAPEDTAVIGWLVMTVESARRAGFQPPADVVESARAWLESVASPRGGGRYSYSRGDVPSPAMTAEAMFVQQLLGHGASEPRMQESAEFIAATPPSWSGGAPTHHWYYATLALFQQQGPTWTSWNEALTRELLAHQRSDGADDGSWDPQDRWSQAGGRVYQTAVCALSLEVYYRYRVAPPKPQ